jgi:hypothetical protein
MAACPKRQPVEDETMNIELSPNKLDLSSAIAEGDIRVLLMVLVHMTGDEKWLEPPYKPKRDVRLIPDPDAGVPTEDDARHARRECHAGICTADARGDGICPA